MIVIISPAKSLDFETTDTSLAKTEIRFSTETKELAKLLKTYKPEQLEKLMGISNKLAQLNYHRFQLWNHPFAPKTTKSCLLAFSGEVYNGIKANTFTNDQLLVAQHKLRILSGFYGLLKPLDSIQPYRLEMGTALKNKKGSNLYAFWGDKITTQLKADLKEENANTVINLASQEYAKAINFEALKTRVITPQFKDFNKGEYKIVSVYAKKARGLMTRFIITNQLSQADDIIAFSEEGYYYHAGLSSPDAPVFVRDKVIK